jgi:riboflavin biosynthesis pyrimidine reductase
VTLPDAYLKIPLVRANLVQGKASTFVDAAGSSRGISNSIDRDRLLALRELADVVVTDGETARLEKYRVPLACDLAVITRIGFRPTPGKSEHLYIELNKSPQEALADLVSRGYERILLEAGPTVVRSLIAADLIDELCLTNTQGSAPNLLSLGIENAKLLFSQEIGDTSFSVWSEIQGV